MEFREIWLVDFEFQAPPGERPRPLCVVAREYHSGRLVRHWLDGEAAGACPYPLGADALLVAYYSSAEWGCHLALGWPLPARVLDLFAEFRNLTNGLPLPAGAGLLGALAWFGLDGIEAAEKAELRALAMRGGPYTEAERLALLDYCQSDVDALGRLLRAMWARIDWPRAWLRGRYMKAAAWMEWLGIPVDVPALEALRVGWADIQEALIARVDSGFGVFDGRTFKADRFAAYLARAGIAWPMLESGALALDDDTFKDMAQQYPALQPLRELRAALGQLRLSDLAVGADGRNRALLSAFRARTGRNQPSNSRFIFGPSVWLRGLIRPEPGWGLAYVDWSQQEFGIAAALSGDGHMLEAYRSGDPYLAFAIQAGAAPAGATKTTHGPVRDQFKACVLAVQYGMGADSLAYRIGQPPARARELLDLHRRVYRRFWQWSDGALDHAMLKGELWTVYGWRVQTGPDPNGRSLRNFPMQANGAEMLRTACGFAAEAGIRVVAPVHDAVLIEAPLSELDGAIAATRAHMARASGLILDGFELGTDVKPIRFPDRYMDERGRAMWETVWDLLGDPGPAGIEGVSRRG